MQQNNVQNNFIELDQDTHDGLIDLLTEAFIFEADSQAYDLLAALESPDGSKFPVNEYIQYIQMMEGRLLQEG